MTRELRSRGAAPGARSIRAVHVHVLRFRLAAPHSDRHILGWAATEPDPTLVRLDARGPLLRATIVGQRHDPDRVVVASYVYFQQPAAPLIWALVGPVHRLAASVLLGRTARSRLAA